MKPKEYTSSKIIFSVCLLIMLDALSLNHYTATLPNTSPHLCLVLNMSFAWHWWVREWHLTLNKSAHNNRKPTLTIRVILLDWLVPFAREPFFLLQRAYMKTNLGFDWWVHHEGVCRHKAHMTRIKAEVCCVMAHWIDYPGPILQ